jgi:hypothetical protein
MYSWPLPDVQHVLHAMVHVWQPMHLLVEHRGGLTLWT